MTKCVCFNGRQNYDFQGGHFCYNGMFIPGVANTSDTTVQAVAEDLSVKNEYDFGRGCQINVPSSTSFNDILREELRKATDTVNRDMHMNNDVCMLESIGNVEGGVCFDPTIEIASATGNSGISGGQGDGDVLNIYENAEEPINEISTGAEDSEDGLSNKSCNSEAASDRMNDMNAVAGPSSKNAEVQWCRNGKLFACTRCGKNFTDKWNVVIHFQNHSGEKPFACRICDKRFSRLGNLNCHMLTHTGKKTFACNICSRTFRLSHHLTGHLRTHTSPFACDQCGERYGTKKHLLMHLRFHTDENLYMCSICKIAFADQSGRNKHYKKSLHIKKKIS